MLICCKSAGINIEALFCSFEKGGYPENLHVMFSQNK